MCGAAVLGNQRILPSSERENERNLVRYILFENYYSHCCNLKCVINYCDEYRGRASKCVTVTASRVINTNLINNFERK